MATSPFFVKPTPLQVVMLKVCAALLPGIAVSVWAFGVGVLVQIALASATALATEAACLKLRGYPVKPFVLDGSALLTGWLLALSIPPLAPWWMVVLGTFIAIGLAKHAFGGLGQNPFNPAMIGFAVLIVSFPAQMSRWAAPLALPQPDLTVLAQIGYILTGHLPQITFDAIASATPLDTVKTGLLQGLGLTQALAAPALQAKASLWINLAYLAGGLYLLIARVIPWQLPAAFLGALLAMSGLMHLVDANLYAAPLFHLGSGAAMLGAFFIITDPVSSPTTPRGRWIFAGLVGLTVYLIRTWGGYPDGVAFAVIIMNIATPFIDRYTQPASFGRKAWEKAKKK